MLQMYEFNFVFYFIARKILQGIPTPGSMPHSQTTSSRASSRHQDAMPVITASVSN